MKWCIYLLIIIAFSFELLASRSNEIETESYKCTVKEYRDLKDNGTTSSNGIYAFLVGKNFVIDRKSGRIIAGKGFSNENHIGKPHVLSQGDQNWSYRVLTLFGEQNIPALIEILTWHEKPEKPFFYYSSGDVYTGLCKAL